MKPGRGPSKLLEVILACCLSSFAFRVMDADAQRIVRIVVYHKTVSNVAYWLGELTGLYRPVEGGETEDKRKLTFESCVAICIGAATNHWYWYNTPELPPNVISTLMKSVPYSTGEQMYADSVRAWREIEARMRH